MLGITTGNSLWPTRKFTFCVSIFSTSDASFPSKPMTTRVQSKKQALAGVMRVSPEGIAAAWFEHSISCSQSKLD